jgi:hypothetical protein
MKALVLYSSLTGNTEKVAKRIESTLKELGNETDCIKVSDETTVELLSYDLVFVGSPAIQWLPAKPMVDSITAMLRGYSGDGKVVPGSPIRVGKFAVCFCTYTGTHIGVHEAVPVTKWIRSFLMHLGFTVLDEWHVPGEFVNNEKASKGSRLGNVTGRPNENDLRDIEQRVRGVIRALTLKPV